MRRDLIGETLLGQFRVETFLAAGGMATIYRVWDLQRSVPLAMKVLHPELAGDPAFITRFQREARSLELLVHPHIVPFYGLYRAGDLTFLLERYIDGPSLDEVLRRRNGQPLRLSEALVYFKALYTSLGYAHARGIIHCDVKPGNVLIDQGGAVYLTDFGIARFADGSSTTSSAIGTPYYMAPEQILGEPVAAQTDIYSLGVLMFELLTGRRPFLGDAGAPPAMGGSTSDRVRYQHLTQPPPDPRSLNPALPPGVAQVILTALAKDPRQRYPSVQVMAAELARAVGARFETLPDRVSLADLLGPAPAWPARPSAEGAAGIHPPDALPPTDTQPGQVYAVPPAAAGRREGRRSPARWLAALGVLAGVVLCALAGFGLLRALQAGLPGFPGRLTVPASATAPAVIDPTQPGSSGTPVPTLTETPVPTLTEMPSPTASPSPSLTPSQTPTRPAGAGPQAGEIVAALRSRGGDQLVLIDLAGGVQALLPGVPDVKVDLSQAPQWSPDGARLTWMSRYNGRMHIVALDLAEGEPYQIAAGETYDQVSSPAFLSGGERISFWASNGRSYWLVIADAVSGKRLDQIKLPDYRNLFVWNWRNGLLAYASGSNNQFDVAVAEAADEGGIIIDTGASEYAPAWSPDGRWLAFQSDSGRAPGETEIWIAGADGSGLHQVTSSPPGSWSRAPSWSPDGRWIAFVSSQAGSAGADYGELFAVEVKTGKTVRLTETGGQVYDWRPAWRP